ncbi:P-loop NTPase [Metallumcola ferriviriculae]|uniref:Stage 0 sporulation protein A homolog n=1 Tax=Metallumcola ferriviriculae TaxID=3039180 RepID=A0AAU0UNF8_9FIRM|nr:P-loop NTPase [Desulfitibacteraceae bacterium MK1]
MKKISILILDQKKQPELEEILNKRQDFQLLKSTTNMDLGFTLAERYQPTVILLNVDLPGNEGMILAEVFTNEFPASSLILTTQEDSEQALRHALNIGAQDVLTLPTSEEKLCTTIQRTVQRDAKRRELFTEQGKEQPQFKTILVFGLKGGVGKTTLATNLALAIKRITGKRVALLDLDLAAGNVALMTGISWSRTLKDLVDEISDVDAELIDTYCADHPLGVKIIQSPADPEVASLIKSDHIDKILKVVRNSFNYVIIDAPSAFSDTILPALEQAKDIMLVTTLDVAAIQNLKKCLDMLDSLNYGRKAKVIVNKVGYSGGIKLQDLKDVIGFEPICTVSNCEKQAINAINRGEPLTLSYQNSKAAKEIEQLALKITKDDRPTAIKKRKLLRRGVR